MRKGIILSGGTGSRLFPCTTAVSKQLLPVFDKPMIFYSLSVLMMAKIKEILIITNEENIYSYKKLFNNGDNLGIKIFYEKQDKPSGIAEALLIGKKFLNNSPCALILGDNIFYGNHFEKLLTKANKNKKNTIFAYRVKNPENYGVVKLNKNNQPIKIIEKPKKNISDLAVTGLYFYDEKSSSYASKIKPSKRGELEITDLNNIYLKKKKLDVQLLPEGFTWFDAGTYDGLLEASMYVNSIQKRQNKMIACLEEIALNHKWINKIQLKKRIYQFKKSGYANYLHKLLKLKFPYK